MLWNTNEREMKAATNTSKLYINRNEKATNWIVEKLKLPAFKEYSNIAYNATMTFSMNGEQMLLLFTLFFHWPLKSLIFDYSRIIQKSYSYYQIVNFKSRNSNCNKMKPSAVV